jgi:hypothetical protein
MFCASASDPEFCDTYASWQKGGVENGNGRLRRWLRHLDIDRTSDQEIQEIVVTTNLTPHKCLGFKTPFQAAELERRCKSASLNPRCASLRNPGMPQAMNGAEVKAFVVRVAGGGSERISSGIQELSNIAIIQKNSGRAPIRLTKANTVLLREPGMSHGNAVEIEAVSPSDADVDAFITSLATMPPIQSGQRVMPFDQNDALWISVGPQRLLLGAGLEECGNPQRGLQAVRGHQHP